MKSKKNLSAANSKVIGFRLTHDELRAIDLKHPQKSRSEVIRELIRKALQMQMTNPAA